MPRNAVVEWRSDVEVRERLDFASRWDSVQRVLDVVLVAASAPIWLPLLTVLLLLKLLIDGRPLLFHQLRVGRSGDPFLIYKIQTTPDSYAPRPEDWPDENFPARTRFGRWLRRFDCDELPQLWNVLKGDMSLVGPRPETPYHSANFARALPGYRNRVLVRPGLTGLAQARGWRGSTSIGQRLSADREYIAQRGCELYFRILLETVWMEMRGKPTRFSQRRRDRRENDLG